MLYVVLFAAVVFYAALFLMWGVVHPHLDSAAMRFASWRDIVVTVPDHTVLIVLRELIVMTMIYLAIDGALSIVRRSLARKESHASYHDYPQRDNTEIEDESWVQ